MTLVSKHDTSGGCSSCTMVLLEYVRPCPTIEYVRPFLLAFVVDRDFLKRSEGGARGRLSSFFHESTSPYNATLKLYRVSHTEHEREERRTHTVTWLVWMACRLT